jgi:4-methyl-5(b-hydroxyethyl)-thiazole monophosphate biosynthesis
MKVYILLATGFEESEALIPFDILKRAGVEPVLCSITEDLAVTSSHGVTVQAATSLTANVLSDGAMLFLPGGMPGSLNLADSEAVTKAVKQYAAEGKWVAAVCAAPLVLGRLGLLQGRDATCYPGFEEELKGAKPLQEEVVVDGPFITACGAGACFALGAKMVEVLKDATLAKKTLRQMMFDVYAYDL